MVFPSQLVASRLYPGLCGRQIKPEWFHFNPLARKGSAKALVERPVSGRRQIAFLAVLRDELVIPADMRVFYLALGWLMVATGIVGAFLPVLPTTPFLLIALWCFSRSSPRLEAWLLSHPKFGEPLRNWREHGAIPRRAKIAAVSLMTMSYAIFWFGTEPSAIRAGIVATVMIAAAVFVVTRPEPKA